MGNLMEASRGDFPWEDVSTRKPENPKTRFKVEFHTRPLQKSLGGVIFMLQKPDLSTRLRYRLNSLFQSKIWLENEQNGVWEKPTCL